MPDNENDKITLAVLSLQISTFTQEIAAMRLDMRHMNASITDYRITQSRHDTEIKNLDTDYVGLSNRVNGWSSINSLGVVLAAVLGMIFGNRNP